MGDYWWIAFLAFGAPHIPGREVNMVLGLPFRTRSPQRDQMADATRVAKVRSALLEAKFSAERECEGLRRRVSEWYDRALAGIDNSEEYALRSPEDQAQIDSSERMGALAQQRLKEVEASIALFDDLLGRLDGASRPGPDGSR
jgi:hypothetical protein